jgi:MoaA/NifB/PqqE/SkfB family radical SAM enzyme
MGALDRSLQRARELQHPLTVHFDLTYRCHQRCLHCYLPEAWRRGEGPGPELDTAQVKGILDQLAAAGTFFLTFSGGEIFLRPDLLTILEYAYPLKFCISLMTSGSRKLDKRQLRSLKDSGVQAILVSLHSLEPELHDRITGVTGSWMQVRRTMEACQALGVMVVLNTFALSINYRSIPALKTYAAQEDIPLRLDDNLSPRWDGRLHPDGLGLNLSQRQWLYKEVGGENGNGKKEAATVPPGPQGGCSAGASRAYLNPRGEVWPCLELPWPCGRLTQGTKFSKLWQESPILNWLRPLLSRDQEVDEPFCVYLRKKRIRPEYGPNSPGGG